MVLKGDCERMGTKDIHTRRYLLDRRNNVPGECSEMWEGMKSNRNNNELNVS